MTREKVQSHNPGLSVSERGLGVSADEYAGLVVVGGEECVNGVRRFGRAVECDDEDAFVARPPDGRHDRLAVVGRDQNGFGAGSDHVLDGRHLAGVVTVGSPGASEQPRTLGVGGRLRAFPHLHEEWIGLGLGDEAYHRVRLRAHPADAEEQRNRRTCDDDWLSHRSPHVSVQRVSVAEPLERRRVRRASAPATAAASLSIDSNTQTRSRARQVRRAGPHAGSPGCGRSPAHSEMNV